jgi:hypothetical protein
MAFSAWMRGMKSLGTLSSASTPPVFSSRKAVDSSLISRSVRFLILAGPLFFDSADAQR